MRPTYDGSLPAAINGDGTFVSTTPGVLDNSSAARPTLKGAANSALMAREWPVNTGTRTHVPLTARSGIDRILRVSLRSLASSSVSPEPSSRKLPACATTLKAIGEMYLFGAGNSTASPE